MIKLLSRKPTALRLVNPSATKIRSEERFSRNAETDLVCRLLLDTATNKIYTLSLHDAFRSNVDDVALGVCKTGAEEAGVTEVRTSLSEKKFELWREIKV